MIDITKPRVPVGILGGMGPDAGMDFLRLFLEACRERMKCLGIPISDQHFPEHWLGQVPIADRSEALRAGATTNAPYPSMEEAIQKMVRSGARHVAIACNTAHFWHNALQQKFTGIEILHIVNEVCEVLSRKNIADVGLLSTEGTYTSRIYENPLSRIGIRCYIPSKEECEILRHGIYFGVKAGNMKLAECNFLKIANQLCERHNISAIIMGCTEIPLALRNSKLPRDIVLIDPTEILASALANRAIP